MEFGPVRSWILQQLPEPARPLLRKGYRLTRDLTAALRTRRGLLSARRVVWVREEVADVESYRLLKPGPGEVLVETRASLISPGTERAFLLGLPNTKASFPTIPGYSAAGVVRQVGSGVTGFQIGNRVAGVWNHSSHSNVTPALLVPLPDSVSFDAASFIELGVIALQGVRRARICPGDRVVVLGQGLVGQLCIQLARWAGAAEIIAVARSNQFAKISQASGADRVIALANDPAAASRLQADVVLEVTGSAAAIVPSLQCARDGGRVSIIGSSRGMTTGIDLSTMLRNRHLEVIGAHITSVAPQASGQGRWTRRDESVLFLDLLETRQLDMKPLITQRENPGDANAVYDELINNSSAAMGIVFDWQNPEGRSKTTMSNDTKTAADSSEVRTMGIGFIGCGEIAAFNATGIKAAKHSRLVQVMDLNLDTAKSLGKMANVPYTNDLDELLNNPDIEAVVIAIPHNLHATITEKAANAGKHVIVEKPIATTLADADRMIAACQDAKVALSVLFSFRYEPHVQKARELVQAGALGSIVGTSIQFATEKPAGYWGQGYSGRALTDWRGSWEKCGGGVLIMNVCHTIDYFQYITGLEVAQAYSEFSTLNSPVEVEDIISATLRYTSGAIGNIQAATLARGERMSEERIWGTHGSITLSPLPSQIYSMRKVEDVSPGKWGSFGKLAKVNRVAAYMDALVRDIRSGRPPAITGEAGRENLAIVLAAYEAGRVGRPIAPGATSNLHGAYLS